MIQLEPLEPRVVLNGAPVALPDASYFTAEDTALTITTSNTTLLDNDWDPEGDSLTASIVDSPGNGSVTGFSGSNGTFTYTPDTSFVGVDTFTYKLNDGTDDGNTVTVSIAVGGHLGPRTNLEERARAGSNLLTGDLELAEPLTPGLFLLYDSGTLPEPIIVVETFLQDTSSVPDEITAELTFNSSTGTTYEFDTTGLSAGDSLRFALQYDATSLSTGRYDYSVDLTTDISSSLVSHEYEGYHDIVNRGAATHPFGRGWQLAGLDALVVDTDGVLWVQSSGDALWFAEDGGGGFDPAEGDITFSTLELDSGTYTLTDKHGNESTFNSSGQLTSREDRNGNTVGYTYTSGLLTKITDPFSRETTFTYTSGQLTSVTDFASRTATLAYDGSGRLTSITQPDPDGGGALTSPVTEFAYDATSHLLTTITDPLDDETDFTYGSHHRLTRITHPDTYSRQFKAMRTLGLPTGTSGNSLTAADPKGDTTNVSVVSKFKTDRYGNVTFWSDPLNHETLTERNSHGQPIRITQEDPDGAGSLTSPVTVLGYDALGNLVYQRNPLGNTRTWTYESSFNLVEVATDELDNETSFDYDAYGNLTELTDAGSGVWTYTYDSGGRVTSATTPDPDGAAPAGPLVASETEFEYDAYGRLDTITHPDESTTVFDYDTADNLTDITDELDNTTSNTYDALGRRTSVTDRESATTSFLYDALGQLLTVTDALGNDTDYEYNSRGWLVSETRPDPDDTGPLTAPETTYTYDTRGNLTVVGAVWMDGSAALEYQYDAADRRTKMKSGIIGADETDYVYDNLGRLSEVTDPLDNETVYEYDAAGNLLKMIQNVAMMDPPEGPTIENTYDAAGRLVRVTDPRGYETDYTYDARGLLTKVELPDPDGAGAMGRPTVIHSYDAIGRYTGFTNSWQRITKYAHDSRDRIVSITQPDPDGGGPLSASVTAFEYDDAGRLISVTDPLSRETAYEYDDEGRVTTITLPDPDGVGSLASPELVYAYNDLGLVTSSTDPLGGATSYEYDNLQRVIQVTLPDPDDTGPLSAPETTYAFSARGLLDTVTDPLGRETTYSYDDFGHRTGVADDSVNETTYAYDVLDRITSVTQEDPDGAGGLTASVTAYAYTYNGQVSTITDPEGGVTRFTYDDAGNLLTVKDSENNTTTYAYDGVGRVTMETNELDDARSFYYDSLGRTAKVLDRNERAVQFEYDAMDRPTHENWYDDASPVPTITIATTTEGGLTDEVQRVGFSDDMGMLSSGTFTLTFDGQTTSGIAWDASAATVQSALEGLSNIDAGEVSVTKTTDWMDTQEWQITFAAGLAGTNVAQTTVDSSNVWGMGTVSDIEATDTQGGSSNNEVQTVTLANEDDGVLRLAFLGETTAEIDFDATAAEVESALEGLNSIDNVTVTGSAGGPWTVTFIGTHAGVDQPRMNGDAAALLSGTEVRDISYTYDAASQLTEASDADSTYAYTYDYLGRVLTVDNDGTSGVPNVVLTSAYDAAGNRTSLAAEIDSTDDFLNTYAYDALHRLTRVDQTQQSGGNTVNEKRVDFSYNAGSQYTEIARFNDTDGGNGDEVATSSFTYDSLGRLTMLEYENGGTDLFTPYEWSYDNIYRITQFVGDDGTTDYEYDKTSQLTDADHDYQSDESYSYDDNGNRTMTGYQTGDNNQLENDGTYSYVYDDEGNRTSRTNDTTDEVTEYEWDHRNRLIQVTEKDEYGATTQVVEYTYDVFNRRIAKAVDTTSPFNMADAEVERYVYDDITGVASLDGGNVVLDFVDPDGEGSTTIDLERRYLYGNAVDQILAQEDVTEGTSSADRVYWPLGDHLGTVRDLVKNDGTLGEHYEYDSYGNVVSGDTSVTRYLFTSREFDEDTGLQYNRARWYDAAVGRWMSEDPIGFLGGRTNLYRYVGDRPTYATDPTGLSETILAAEGRVAGKAIEEGLAQAGAETQQVIIRSTGRRGVVDAIHAGKHIEIGPASPTGVPAKASQAAAAMNADVILYKQQGKIPKAGSFIDYVRLPFDKLKQLQAQAKANGWTRDQIWKSAKNMGAVVKVKVSSKAAGFAGRLYLGGRIISKTTSAGTLGVSPLDILLDTIDWCQDPKGWKQKPAYMFPGMLVLPQDHADPHHPPMA